ncbi:MAG: hypothetical protein KAT91_04025, partial [Candidatus Aenigmarchaeota archaeon]|nr:hypothetical protein [Candidatus Aenigmarchaeota archaeon]
MPEEKLEAVKAAYRDLCSNHSDLFNSSDAEELKNTRGHLGLDSFCKSEHNVSLKDVIKYAIYRIEQKESESKGMPHNDTIISETTESSSPSPRTDEILHDIKNARREEIYSQKLATPAYGGNRLSDEDGTEVIKYLFEHNFDAVFIADLKEKLKSSYTVILDTPYIFELALLNLLQTDKYKDSNTEDYWETPKTTKNEEFVSKLDKLYEFITKERIENEMLNDEDIYLPALNAIISNNFKSIKQGTLNEIFEELKKRDAISKTFEEFMKEKGNSKIQSNEFHPSVLIYNALERERFEKDFTKNALEWYKTISETGFSKCFYDSAAPPEKVEESVNGRLTKVYDLCLDGSGRSIRKNIGMEYIEYINTIKLAKDFLQLAGFNGKSEKIMKTINETVNAPKALNIIKQQKDKRADGARELFLNTLEFMKSEGYSFPPKDTQNLLKEWYLQETKAKGGKKTYRPYDRYFKTESLDSRILKMYKVFGGERKDLVVTPAQVFKEQKVAAERQRQQMAAEVQRNIDKESARRAEYRRQFEESPTEYKRFKE